MRDNTLRPLVILAVNAASESEDQSILSEFVGFPFNRPALTGCYKGEVERSYILEVGDKSLQQIIEFAKQNNQESVLYLDNQRLATLYYDINTREPIGKFVGVSREEALSSDAYTYNPEINQYYVVK